jgi:hypothetical protein
MSNTTTAAQRETIDVALDGVWACAAIGAEGADGCGSLVRALQLESPAPAWGYDEPHACQKHDMRLAARMIVNAIMESRRLPPAGESCLEALLVLGKERPANAKREFLVENLLGLAAMAHCGAPQALFDHQKNLVVRLLATL